MLYDEVELWAFDEHRIGLLPVLSKVWAPKGQRPIIKVKPRYQWLYLYAFVQPETGQTLWYILPELNTTAFQLVLDNFARSVSASAQKRILIVLDGAPWHRSNDLEIPEGIEFIFQPRYSPELQPVERLWPLSDELIKNRCPDDLNDLELKASIQCQCLINAPDRVKAHTLFHWWPRLN